MSGDAPLLDPVLWTRLREFMTRGGTGSVLLTITDGQAVELAITEVSRVPRRPAPSTGGAR